MAAPPTNGVWVRQFHPAPDAHTVLVVFPHAGGSATFYHPLSQAVSPWADVLVMQYPGRQDRIQEPCVDDIHTMADRMTEELLRWAERPTTLLGHSMGALLAFEVARRLEARGTVPLGLFASGRRAPSCSRDERLHLHDDEELIAEIARLSGTDAELLADKDVLHLILPALRNDYQAVETYRYIPGTPLTCPVIALTADDDTLVDQAEARAWAQHTTAGFHHRRFTGGHFFLTAHADAVVQEITGHIAGSHARDPSDG